MSDEIEDSGNSLAESDLIPGEQWNRGSSDSLKQTKLGLNFVYFGIGLVVVSVLGALYLLLSSKLPTVALSILPLGGAVGFLMIFVGPIICLAVPENSNTRGLLFGAALCLSSNLIYSGTDFFDPGFLTMPMRLFLRLVGIIGLVLFILFMKSLAIYINRQDLVAKTTYLLSSTVLLLVGAWLFYFLRYLNFFYFNSSSLIISIGVLLAMVMYTIVVGDLKEVLAPSLNSSSTSESQNQK